MDRIGSLERKYVMEVLDNGFRTSANSEFNTRLETGFAGLFGSKYAIGLVNGTATLHTALAACGVKPGEEVIVPPLTMSSPAISVLQNGSIPVFADVDKKSFTLTAEGIESVITEKTKAVMPVSLYGASPDYDSILEICSRNNLFLIEDNAECFLSRYKGKAVGTFGDFASYSFQASKHLSCGEGGMLITDNESLADKARKFSGLGYAGVSSSQRKITRKDIQNPSYNRHLSMGFNFRMSELTAAVALGQLERAEELVAVRKKSAEMFLDAIDGFTSVVPQKSPDGADNSYWAFAMVLNTDKPESDWYEFRKMFLENGGDSFYAAWKLSYMEPLFSDTVINDENVWQKYEPGLCPDAEYLQPRMIQMKTNYWNLDDAEKQAEILYLTLNKWESR